MNSDSRFKRGFEDKSACKAAEDNEQGVLFLPDFCDLRMVFAVVIIGELLAFILTLAQV